jgi:hypothetical protein
VKAAAFALGLMILAPHAASAPRTVPFRAGETLTYDVSWATFLVAGTVVMTVKDRKPSFDSTAYYIVAEARPAPFLAKLYSLYYKLDTLLDVYSLLPQQGSLYTEEGNRHRLKTTRFDRTARKAFFEDQPMTTVKADFPIAASTLDALSSLYVLRTIPLKAGLHVTMPVTDDGLNYKLTIDVAAPERIKTPIGEIAAWKAIPVITDDKGQTIGKNLAMWISADARRYPLKIQADVPVGSFVLQLREAR